MGKYAKQSIAFTVKDFFRTGAKQLIVTAVVLLIGFVIGIVVSGPFDGADVESGCGGAIWWLFITILPPYLCVLTACISKYLVFTLALAFVFLGIRLGNCIEFLLIGAGFKGIMCLLIVYLPVFILTFFAFNVALYALLPYFSSSPNCKTYPNCIKSWRTILSYVLGIFCVNLVVICIWTLLFGSFIDVIIIVNA